MTGSERAARAEVRRKTAMLNRTTVQRIEPDLSPVAGAAAISLVERLTRESWTAANLPFPSYLRAQTPVRFVPERLT